MPNNLWDEEEELTEEGKQHYKEKLIELDKTYYPRVFAIQKAFKESGPGSSAFLKLVYEHIRCAIERDDYFKYLGIAGLNAPTNEAATKQMFKSCYNKNFYYLDKEFLTYNR